jgi:hypothetical protein
MAHTITVSPKDDLQTTLSRVETTIVGKGGRFAGNTENGNFSGVTPIGMVKGTYVVRGSNIEITITDKPFLAPQAIIDNKIRDYFS